MAKYVDIEPLERKFEERYLDYRNRSQSELFTGMFRVDETLTTAAMIMESCLDSLRKAKAADVAPVRHGRWGTHSDRPDSLICSVCNCGFDMWKHDPHNYCPNCGTKMDLEG